MSHWAAQYIGSPWAPGAEGPEAFGCYGLVRSAAARGYDLILPPLGGYEVAPERERDVALAIAVAALQRQASEWRPVEGEPLERDIIVIRGPNGLHVGLVIRADRRLLVLHADGRMVEGVPVGQVVAQPIADMLAGGYSGAELWRRAA